MGEWVFGWEEFGEIKKWKEKEMDKITKLLKKGIENGEFPNKLYKFRDFSDFTDKIILNSEFYFASPKKFNDPFDCNLSYKQDYTKNEILAKYQDLTSKLPFTKEEFINKYGLELEEFLDKYPKLNDTLVSKSGILSLSKSNKNITMWSHYANEHKGLVFELQVDEDYNFFHGYGIVEYKEQYDFLSYTNLTNEDYTKLFLTKYTDWEYEEEIRIIDYNKNETRKFNKSVLKTIYFGYRADETNIKKTIQLCQLNEFEHVIFKKAKLIPGKFALDFDEINKSLYL